MMNTERNRDAWFDDLLREDHSSPVINYDAVEAALLTRIGEAEALGVLSLLKMDKIARSYENFQRVEKDLFARIAQYKEYEEPINECIRAGCDLTSAQWERLEAKLVARINGCSEAPLWEKFIMAPENEPLPGKWERIEGKILKEIAQSNKQEPWVLCARNEEVHTPAVIEQEELLIEKILGDKEPAASFERELRREEVLSLSQLERIEDSLFGRIDRHNARVALEKQPFWNLIWNYLTIYKAAGVLTALILSVAGFTGYNHYIRSTAPVDTFVYQAQGTAVNIPGIFQKIDQSCLSIMGGTVKLLNRHGTVELRNDSKIELLKTTRAAAHYRVSLPSGDQDRGSGSQVTFLVNKHRPDEEFLIHTSDYRITVTGTYFRLEPGYRGTVTTKVLEGAVKISSGHSKETELHAGQIYEYDSLTERYIVKGGGQVVLRKNIDAVPEADSIIKSGMLQINCAVNDVRVHINGKFYGFTPVIMRCRAGDCKITLSKEGYRTLDTLITVSDEKRNSTVSFVLKASEPAVAVHTEPVFAAGQQKQELKPGKPVVSFPEQQADPVITPEQISGAFLEPDSSELEEKEYEELYLKAQKEELAGNWEAAVDLYRKVFDNQNGSRLIREDALFSIGRLKTDNIYNPSEASQTFLTYLALFPEGSFAGESWLRLAELEFRNRPESAAWYYEKFFQLYPQHPRTVELKNRVGIIYLQQKRFDKAIDLFKQALDNPSLSDSKERAIILDNLDRALHGKTQSSKGLVNNHLNPVID